MNPFGRGEFGPDSYASAFARSPMALRGLHNFAFVARTARSEGG